MKAIIQDEVVIPSFGRFLREAGALADLARRGSATRPVVRQGDGRPVLVIPGFLSTDGSTQLLRATLSQAGYNALPWGRGLNLGVRAGLLEDMAAQVAEISDREQRKVAIVGWSLGGLYAREIAKLAPDKVSRVVTMGSPFSGSPRANRVWWLYELINRHPVDRLPIEVDLCAKPPVRTVALWSREDGIVAPACARGLPHEVDEAVEVGCSHIGFMSCADAFDAVFDALEA